MTQIERLTMELEANLRDFIIAKNAMRWEGYVTDQAMVTRKLMALDYSIMKLSKLIPDEYIGEETPQEYAAPVAAILKAEYVMMGAQ